MRVTDWPDVWTPALRFSPSSSLRSCLHTQTLLSTTIGAARAALSMPSRRSFVLALLSSLELSVSGVWCLVSGGVCVCASLVTHARSLSQKICRRCHTQVQVRPDNNGWQRRPRTRHQQQPSAAAPPPSPATRTIAAAAAHSARLFDPAVGRLVSPVPSRQSAILDEHE